MCLLCCWIIEGEVLLGEVEAVAEREVPQGEAEGGGQQQDGAEPKVPLGEQEHESRVEAWITFYIHLVKIMIQLWMP